MVFSEFRRRFDVLAPHLTKKHGRHYIVTDEKRVSVGWDEADIWPWSAAACSFMPQTTEGAKFLTQAYTFCISLNLWMSLWNVFSFKQTLHYFLVESSLSFVIKWALVGTFAFDCRSLKTELRKMVKAWNPCTTSRFIGVRGGIGEKYSQKHRCKWTEKEDFLELIHRKQWLKAFCRCSCLCSINRDYSVSLKYWQKPSLAPLAEISQLFWIPFFFFLLLF